MNSTDTFTLDTAGLSEAVLEQPLEKAEVKATKQRPRQSTNRGRQALYFDLETVPDYDRLDVFNLDPLPDPVPQTPMADCPLVSEMLGRTIGGIKATLASLNPDDDYLFRLRANETTGKNRSGVIDAIKAAGKAGDVVESACTDRRKLLSTTPEYCRVAAMGWAAGNDDVQSLVLDEDVDERRILTLFWELCKEHSPLIGFNIIGFDLPVLFFRSALLAVPSSKLIDLKPWGTDVCDVYLKRFGGRGSYGGGRPGKLKELAPLSGIEVPAEDVDGSQVEQLLIDGDVEKLGEYVRSDVVVTRELHHFYSGYFC